MKRERIRKNAYECDGGIQSYDGWAPKMLNARPDRKLGRERGYLGWYLKVKNYVLF